MWTGGRTSGGQVAVTPWVDARGRVSTLHSRLSPAAGSGTHGQINELLVHKDVGKSVHIACVPCVQRVDKPDRNNAHHPH
jgi:hypothetical protein